MNMKQQVFSLTEEAQAFPLYSRNVLIWPFVLFQLPRGYIVAFHDMFVQIKLFQ